jgi:hypothetical protein
MKLYTEEQVKTMLIKTDKFTPLHIEHLMNEITPIELPSDEEINKEIEWLDNPLERLHFKAGIKWMRDKIRIQRR